MRSTNDKNKKGNTKVSKTKKKATVGTKNKKQDQGMHVFSIVVILIMIMLCIFGVATMVSNLTGKSNDLIEASKFSPVTLFDNGETNESHYLYVSDDNTKDTVSIKEKKSTATKKVYDLKICKTNLSQEKEMKENMELVVDRKYIKIGDTILYKKDLKENESFQTTYEAAKNKKAEIIIDRETELELVIKIKYIDKNDTQILEELVFEKGRGLVRKIKINLQDDKALPIGTELVKTYFKLPENIKWHDLFEDYMAE